MWEPRIAKMRLALKKNPKQAKRNPKPVLQKNLKNRYKKEVNQMQAYCVKCKAKREMKDARSITMKNGRPATQGVCPTCGTKMFRIGSTK